MTRDEYNRFCEGLTATANVVQWGGASVWKVGGETGKVFAVYSDWGRNRDAVVLKPSEMAREIWRDAPGVRLAPYLGRAGWIQIDHDAMAEEELQGLIAGSHAIMTQKLTKKRRAELGL